MIVMLAKLCAYVLLPCLAFFEIEIMAINHGAELGIYENLLGITNSLPPIKQSTVHRQTLKVPNLIDSPNMVYQGFFNQKQNHFDYIDTTTWPQRYYVSKAYFQWASYNPVIFLLGGLHELTHLDFKTGVWDALAKETGALLVCLEHRYRGQSEPTGNLSIDNLLYLNSEQALADAAWFIKNARENKVGFLHEVTYRKWIAVGASHGGALAAKLKLKYSHLLDGALAVDAPLLATKKFAGYYEEIFGELNTNVVANRAVLEAYETIEGVITDQTTVELELKERFNLCDRQQYTNKDMQLFLWSISTLLGFAMQSNGLKIEESIKYQVMEILKNESNGNELDRFGLAIRTILKEMSISCLNINYDDAVTSYRRETWNSPIDDLLYFGLGNRQDLFQSCTQFGQFEVYDKYVPLEFYGDFCEAVFGMQYGLHNLEQGLFRSNTFYGGLNIAVEDVYFISHKLNYFIQLGISDNTPVNSDAICINAPFYLSSKHTDREASTRNEEWDKIVLKLKQWAEYN